MTTGISSTPDAADAVPCSETIEDQLPKLSAADFRIYNKQAEMMNYYHNHFRQSWRTLYSACENNARPKGMTILQFMNVGIQLCHHLNVHHGIEEQHIFPVLAQRMPEFSHSAKPASDPRARLMVQQHKQIHAGLERLEKYLDDCKSGNLDFKLTGDEGSLKEVMDSFGAVLWEHLDEEVRLLGAQNMRKYWSKQEIQNMNW